MFSDENVSKYRKPEFPAERIFVNRWSPRAMSGEEITEKELMTLFEAAKWAPSSYNNQSWRFIYAKKNTEYWKKLFDLMGEFNQAWAKNASVLVVIISKKTFDFNGKPSITHSFDSGSAWMSLALQGSIKRFVVHGMQGFDYDKTKKDLEIPEEFEVEAMAAIGKPGKKEFLPKEMQEKEFPSDRKKLKEIVFEGKFRE